jgi:hypothetical protein
MLTLSNLLAIPMIHLSVHLRCLRIYLDDLAMTRPPKNLQINPERYHCHKSFHHRVRLFKMRSSKYRITLTHPVGYSEYFPLKTDEHRKLRAAMNKVMNSHWKIENRLEPTPQYLLQFCKKIKEENGTVTYKCLFYHGGRPCQEFWNNAESALAHVRATIYHEPFVCEDDENIWYGFK